MFKVKGELSSLKVVDFSVATDLSQEKYVIIKILNFIFTLSNIIDIYKYHKSIFDLFIKFSYLFPKCGTPGFIAPEILNMVDET